MRDLDCGTRVRRTGGGETKNGGGVEGKKRR